MHVAQLFEHMGVVDRRTARADRDMTQPSKGANSMNREAVPFRLYS
jgi:hypothetical protein